MAPVNVLESHLGGDDLAHHLIETSAVLANVQGLPMPTVGTLVPRMHDPQDSQALSVAMLADLAPAFCAGLGDALRALGWHVSSAVQDLDSWVVEHPGGVVATQHIQTEQLHRHGAAVRFVVLLSAPPAVKTVRSAVAAGATALLSMSASITEIVAAMQLAVEGHAVMPAHHAQDIAATEPDLSESPALSSEDIVLLQMLADGQTVAAIAQAVGYSERSLFRRLHDLYRRFHVEHRRDAVQLAKRMGVLTSG